MRLNSKWLIAAWVSNPDGSRMGMVSAVDGDKVEVLSKGKILGTFSAVELDNAGRLSKPDASHRKYI
jgi:hypothetical protein